MSRRYNCGCGKKRYRDEPAALAAAAADQETFGGVVTAYRCPGGLAWHLTAHGFTPEALRSVARRLAFELVERGDVGLGEFGAWALRLDARPDARRQARLERCAAQLTESGLARWVAPGHLGAVDHDGLRRVIQIGLDAFLTETEAKTGGPRA